MEGNRGVGARTAYFNGAGFLVIAVPEGLEKFHSADERQAYDVNFTGDGIGLFRGCDPRHFHVQLGFREGVFGVPALGEVGAFLYPKERDKLMD